MNNNVVSMKRKIITILGVAVCLAGCVSTSQHCSLLLIDCLPRFDSRQPYKGTDDPMADQWETDLLLASTNGTYRIMWFKGDGPPPVALDTNRHYSFTIDLRPDWAFSGYLHCPGGAVPAGFLREISDNGKTIWKDAFYKKVGCY